MPQAAKKKKEKTQQKNQKAANLNGTRVQKSAKSTADLYKYKCQDGALLCHQ